MQLQKQEHYINLQMDPLCDPLTTRPIQTGWEICIEPYPNWRCGCVDNPDRQFGTGSVVTRTQTRSDGPEPSLTQPMTCLKYQCILIIPIGKKNICVCANCLRQSGRAPSEPSETPRWRITLRLASTPRVKLHIALRSPFRRFFYLCRSPTLNKPSGVVANWDHTCHSAGRYEDTWG